jgi:RNA polymerase-binding transcription factor
MLTQRKGHAMTNTDARHDELKQMLETRRRDLHNDVHRRIRDGLTARTAEVHDEIDSSDTGFQGDMDLALLQMRTETVIQIDNALVRLGAGEYGTCLECATDIPERRLRAVPFAVRCQACESGREVAYRQVCNLEQRPLAH